MTSGRRAAVLLAGLTLSSGLLGALYGHFHPRDAAELRFDLADSRFTGEADDVDLNAALYELFRDLELSEAFAREWAQRAAEVPEAGRWLSELLRREGSSPLPEELSERARALRELLQREEVRQLSYRLRGTVSRARSDLLLYSPARGQLRLHLGFGGEAALRAVAPVTAAAFNAAIDRLNARRFERWRAHLESFGPLLENRIETTARYTDSLAGKIEALQRGIAARLDPTHAAERDLAAYLSGSEPPTSAGIAERIPVLVGLGPELPDRLAGQLSELEGLLRYRELLLATDWLDVEAFGTRSYLENKSFPSLWFVPAIPAEQASFDSGRRVEPLGAVVPGRWVSPVGFALVGLALGAALLAVRAGWERYGAERAR